MMSSIERSAGSAAKFCPASIVATLSIRDGSVIFPDRQYWVKWVEHKLPAHERQCARVPSTCPLICRPLVIRSTPFSDLRIPESPRSLFQKSVKLRFKRFVARVIEIQRLDNRPRITGIRHLTPLLPGGSKAILERPLILAALVDRSPSDIDHARCPAKATLPVSA